MINWLIGHTSLSWIMRVQIALDAARGLEYIHEHTKTHYVHRDIKTSNILLDGTFRAKVQYIIVISGVLCMYAFCPCQLLNLFSLYFRFQILGWQKFLVKQVREKLR